MNLFAFGRNALSHNSQSSVFSNWLDDFLEFVQFYEHDLWLIDETRRERWRTRVSAKKCAANNDDVEVWILVFASYSATYIAWVASPPHYRLSFVIIITFHIYFSFCVSSSHSHQVEILQFEISLFVLSFVFQLVRFLWVPLGAFRSECSYFAWLHIYYIRTFIHRKFTTNHMGFIYIFFFVFASIRGRSLI